MSELLEAFVRLLVAIVEFIFGVMVFLVSRAATLVAHLCSKRFRNRKDSEWKEHKVRKFSELGFSGICIAGLITISVWLFLPGGKSEQGAEANGKPALEVEQAESGEDLRLKLKVAIQNGQEEDVRIIVKEGGAAKILGTDTTKELRQQIAENVTVIRAAGATNSETASETKHTDKPTDE